MISPACRGRGARFARVPSIPQSPMRSGVRYRARAVRSVPRPLASSRPRGDRRAWRRRRPGRCRTRRTRSMGATNFRRATNKSRARSASTRCGSGRSTIWGARWPAAACCSSRICWGTSSRAAVPDVGRSSGCSGRARTASCRYGSNVGLVHKTPVNPRTVEAS